jgi:hypothetical protein
MTETEEKLLTVSGKVWLIQFNQLKIATIIFACFLSQNSRRPFICILEVIGS